MSSPDIAHILDAQDANGDTAVLIAAGHGARKCVRCLLGHGAASQIMNRNGETAERLIARFNSQKRDAFPMASSSPFQQPSADPYPLDPKLAPPMPDGPLLEASSNSLSR
ncbi:MAG: hypothetical protein M4579_007701, partial [Chaenotheca gracillima]